ncbi:hypothetical protein ILUMI_03039 [Ignelater luminosus]|uniref:Uncharacterized protein n=1 Tax=Ignelater luminosus TaxID=2038154 RepID=A0A8K0GKA9_IGNLU|nr:hypothetical protein ILUMI_03039 [Ignelater luminosus]
MIGIRTVHAVESNKDPSVLDVSRKVLIDITTISDQRIIEKVRDYNKYKALKKNMKSAYNKQCFAKIEIFKKDILKLVDASPCKFVSVPLQKNTYMRTRSSTQRKKWKKYDNWGRLEQELTTTSISNEIEEEYGNIKRMIRKVAREALGTESEGEKIRTSVDV